MTKPLRPGPDSNYSISPHDDRSGRRLARRVIGAGAAVVVAGAALSVGLQAATPDQVQAPVPATSGADAPTTSVVPAPSHRARDDDEGDDEGDDEAGAPLKRVAPIRVAPVVTPAPAPVASSGGSGG